MGDWLNKHILFITIIIIIIICQTLKIQRLIFKIKVSNLVVRVEFSDELLRNFKFKINMILEQQNGESFFYK